MCSIITDLLPTEIKSKPYYVHAKNAYLQHKLRDAAKAGQDVYENAYNKVNNCAYALKENNHIISTYKKGCNTYLALEVVLHPIFLILSILR